MSKKMYDNPYKEKENLENQEVDHNDHKNSEETNSQKENDSVEIDKNQEKISELEKQIADLKNKIVYLAAENENTRKRLLQEKSEAINFANGKILSSFVDPIECLYLAMQAMKDEKSKVEDILKVSKEGLEMTVAKFEQLFSQNNIKRIHPVGEKFDYKSHQAVSEIEKNDSEPGMIVNVVAAGYSLNGLVVKPAMVVVSK
jgi:molecular chaperone GrpE